LEGAQSQGEKEDIVERDQTCEKERRRKAHEGEKKKRVGEKGGEAGQE